MNSITRWQAPKAQPTWLIWVAVPYVTDTVFGESCTVFSFAEQTGLSLDSTDMFGSSAYSFAALIRLAETDDYAKILDIHNRVDDEGLYARDNGLIFYDYYDNGLTQLSNDTWARIVFAYDGTTLRGYVNGVEAFNEEEEVDYGDGAITSNTLFFFRDDFYTEDEENSAGRVANIQLFDHALTGQEAADLVFSCANTPPPPTVDAVAIPTMSTWGKIGLIFVLMLAGIGISRRRIN